MKRPIVSALAVLFCCLVLVIVAGFGYSRYKAAQAANAEFSAELQSSGTNSQSGLGAHMPPQLPPRATTAGGSGPAPAQP